MKDTQPEALRALERREKIGTVLVIIAMFVGLVLAGELMRSPAAPQPGSVEIGLTED